LNPEPLVPGHSSAHAEYSAFIAQEDVRGAVFQPPSPDPLYCEEHELRSPRALEGDCFECSRLTSSWPIKPAPVFHGAYASPVHIYDDVPNRIVSLGDVFVSSGNSRHPATRQDGPYTCPTRMVPVDRGSTRLNQEGYIH